MILDTFTKDELLSTLKGVIPIFKERAQNFMAHNARDIAKKAKYGAFYKTISGVIDGQRYYYNVVYVKNKDYLEMGNGPLITVVSNGKRNLVVELHDWEDPNSTDGTYLKVFTEHFLTRFCDRMGFDVEKMSLIDKTNAFGANEEGHYSSTVLGDFMRKYDKTKLNAKFLDTTIFKTWYAASRRGDIAIVEQYGSVPVWRTFISKEMLFEDQVNDPNYRMIKEMSEKQVKNPEEYIPDFLFEANRAQKK